MRLDLADQLATIGIPDFQVATATATDQQVAVAEVVRVFDQRQTLYGLLVRQVESTRQFVFAQIPLLDAAVSRGGEQRRVVEGEGFDA